MMRNRRVLGTALLFIFAMVLAACGDAGMGQVTGVVTTSDGKPVVNAEIQLGALEATTNAEGAFAFDEVKRGTYTLTVSIDDREMHTRAVTVRGTTTVSVELPAGELVFYEDFSGDLSEWALSIDGDGDPNDYISLSGGSMLFSPLWFGNAFAGDADWTDYTAEVEFEVLEYGQYASTRLFFRSADVWEGYSVSVVSDRIVLHRFDGNWDKAVILEEVTDVQTPVNRRITVRVEAEGDTFKVYHNGVLVVEASDAEGKYPAGMIGVRADNSRLRVHRVAVWELN